MHFSSIAVNTTFWTIYGDYFDTCVGDTTNAQMHALLTIKKPTYKLVPNWQS